MEHLPHRVRLWRARQGFCCESRRPAGLVVNRSTSRRVAPTGANILTVLHYARNRRIAVGIREHLGSTRLVVLRVVVEERNTLAVVVLARLLAIRTSRLGIDN